MKNIEDIEKEIQGKLNTRTFDIKSDWRQDMDQKLDALNKRKKRRGILFMLFGLGALLISGLSYVLLMPVSDSSEKVAHDLVVNGSINEVVDSPSNSDELTDSQNELSTEGTAKSQIQSDLLEGYSMKNPVFISHSQSDSLFPEAKATKESESEASVKSEKDDLVIESIGVKEILIPVGANADTVRNSQGDSDVSRQQGNVDGALSKIQIEHNLSKGTRVDSTSVADNIEQTENKNSTSKEDLNLSLKTDLADETTGNTINVNSLVNDTNTLLNEDLIKEKSMLLGEEEDRSIQMGVNPERNEQNPIGMVDVQSNNDSLKNDADSKEPTFSKAENTEVLKSEGMEAALANDLSERISEKVSKESKADSVVSELNGTAEVDSTKKDVEDSLKIKLPTPWSIVLDVSNGNVGKNFHSTSLSPDLNERRQNEETALNTFEYGLGVRYAVSSKVTIGSGLKVAKYGELVNYTPLKTLTIDTSIVLTPFQIIDVDSSFTTSFWTFDSVFQQGTWFYFDSIFTPAVWNYDTTITNGQDTITEINQIASLDSGILAANGYTKFTYMEIPIYVQYKWSVGKKWDVTVGGGPTIGFLIKEEGRYYDGNVVMARSRKMIYNVNTSLEVLYNLNDRFAVGSYLFARVNLNNASLMQEERRTYYGGRIGIRCHIKL